MGCDIHCHIEVKINGRWEHLASPNIQRDYSLFARMADVRNRDGSGIVPIAQPRGMVNDPSIVTEIDFAHGGSDYHSHSWLSGAELEALIHERQESIPKEGDQYHHPWQPWRRGGFGYCFGSGFDVQKYPNDYPDGVTDCRLVFWFDN